MEQILIFLWHIIYGLVKDRGRKTLLRVIGACSACNAPGIPGSVSYWGTELCGGLDLFNHILALSIALTL